MNPILFLLLLAAHVACQKADEAIAAVPTYKIELASLLITQDQGPEQTPETRIATEQPFTCPAQVPAQYAGDPRAQYGRLVVVFKRHFRIALYHDGAIMWIDGAYACFPIAMGAAPEFRKVSRDGMSTPEGWYHVASKRDVGATTFYRAFHVNYPNAKDVELAYKLEVIDKQTRDRALAAIRAGKVPAQETDMGGWIMIHGMGSQPRGWTLGCIALDNKSIDAIFPYVDVKTPILILPWSQS